MSLELSYKNLQELQKKSVAIEAVVAERKQRSLLLQNQIAQANTNLALQPDVDSYLVHLQRKVHQRSVGLYEQLLTALVQDILPENVYPISLQLDTDKGLPALSIELGKDDEAQDIYDDTGGSLTNVVSAGLRFIALARSGLRKFLVLDEPDCWIEPDRIPRFANILADMSAKIKVQTILISHYKGNAFSNIGNRLKLEKNASNTIIVTRDRIEPWLDDNVPGIRWIRLENFMSHKDTLLELGPGINSLSGPNHIGKSAVVHALRVFAYHLGADRNIMHKQSNFKISIGLEKGKVLTCTRNRKGARKTVYSYIDPSMTEARVEPAGKSGIPDFVSQELNIQRLNDLDIQLSHQKMPVFLLNEPKTKQASILSAGLESDHVRNMLKEYKSWLDIDRATIRNNEKEYQSIKPYLDNWDKTFTHSLSEEGKKLENDYLLLNNRLEKSQKLKTIIEFMERAESLNKSLPNISTPEKPELLFKKEMSSILESWTKSKKLSSFSSNDAVPVVPNIEVLLKVVESYRQWKRASNKVNVLDNNTADLLEPKLPEINNLNITKLLNEWNALNKNLNHNVKLHDNALEELENVNKEYHSIIHETKGVCPLCHQHWEPN